MCITNGDSPLHTGGVTDIAKCLRWQTEYYVAQPPLILGSVNMLACEYLILWLCGCIIATIGICLWGKPIGYKIVSICLSCIGIGMILYFGFALLNYEEESTLQTDFLQETIGTSDSSDIPQTIVVDGYTYKLVE